MQGDEWRMIERELAELSLRLDGRSPDRLGVLAENLRRRGHLAAAVECAHKALELAEWQCQDALGRCNASLQLGELLLMGGRAAEAEDYLRRAWQSAQEGGARHLKRSGILRLLSKALRAQGKDEEASGFAAQAAAQLDELMREAQSRESIRSASDAEQAGLPVGPDEKLGEGEVSQRVKKATLDSEASDVSAGPVVHRQEAPLVEETVVAGPRDTETVSSPAKRMTDVPDGLDVATYRWLRRQVESVVWRAYWETVYEGRPAPEVAAELGVGVAAVFLYRERVRRLLGVGPLSEASLERRSDERAPHA